MRQPDSMTDGALCMASRQAWINHQRWQRSIRIAPLLAMLIVSGCAQVNKRVGERLIRPNVVVTPAAASRRTTAPPAADLSLAAIVHDELQHGHYAAGETALRRYLAQHPRDRSAEAMLRQLTVDPEQRLGRESQAHVVEAGDSYSTLAARYLGDAGLFLILARYNHSADPSLLQVGETVRLPMSATGVSAPTVATGSGVDGSDRGAAAGTTVDGTPSIPQSTASGAEAAAAKAQRLQRESVALLDHGHKQQALARLDQALVIEPQLKPSGSDAVSLRNELVTSFHQRAIVLYRDQQLDPAIALWNRVLAIDPNYEPAVIYRTRALELKRRLKQF
jgi:tetratricopeptide (TPR) repeat protein